MTTHLRAAEVIDQQIGMGYDVRRYPHRLVQALAEAGVLADDSAVEVPEPAPSYQSGDVAIDRVAQALDAIGALRNVTDITDEQTTWINAPLAVVVEELTRRGLLVTSRAVVVTEDDQDELIKAANRIVPSPRATEAIREWFAARLGGGR